MVKAHKYRGILAKPARLSLVEYVAKLAPDNVDLQKRAEVEFDAQSTRLRIALFEDCGVQTDDPNGWVRVAATLAQRHVPGYSYADPGKATGRPSKGDDDVIDIFQQMKARVEKGQTIRDAARHVARSRRRGESPAAIDRLYRRTYTKFVKAFAALANLMRQS